MKASCIIEGLFHCSLERAFKAPILGDATKFLDGYLLQAPVVRFEEDDKWGQVGGIRYPVISDNFLFSGGRIFTDTILQKEENQYWKWKVHDFTTSALFFAHTGIGEWSVQELATNQISVRYRYTYEAQNWLLYPINFLFVHIQMRGMMKKAMKGIKAQAESGERLIYEIKMN